jgi:hypothetical protein
MYRIRGAFAVGCCSLGLLLFELGCGAGITQSVANQLSIEPQPPQLLLRQSRVQTPAAPLIVQGRGKLASLQSVAICRKERPSSAHPNIARTAAAATSSITSLTPLIAVFDAVLLFVGSAIAMVLYP